MPGFGDSAFIILLALLLFGPKKLPVLARQLGKLMGDFRRASNEFRYQMEEELRVSEQAERDRKLATLEASVVATPTPTPDPDIPTSEPAAATSDFASFGFPDMSPDTPPDASASGDPSALANTPEHSAPLPGIPEHSIAPPAAISESVSSQPIPVATAGDLAMMPPSTGLPVPSTSGPYSARNEAETLSDPVAEIVHHG